MSYGEFHVCHEIPMQKFLLSFAFFFSFAFQNKIETVAEQRR